MGFLTNLFGGQTNIWTIGFSLILVIVLIVAGVWLLKMLFNVSGNMARGRQKRLCVVESMPIDNKNNLVIVRDGATEHLLVLSNNSATLVQANINGNASSYDGTNAIVEPTQDILTEAPATRSGKIAAAIAGTAAIAGAGVASAANTVTPKAKTDTSQIAIEDVVEVDPPTTDKQRFGLSRFLRRKSNSNPDAPLKTRAKPNEPAAPKATKPTPKLEAVVSKPKAVPAPIVETTPKEATPELAQKSATISQLRAEEEASEIKQGPSLRHTGLLVPVSEMVGISKRGNAASSDKDDPLDNDSDMNEAEQIDSDAMESIEEGAASKNDAAKSKSSRPKLQAKAKPASKPAKKSN